MISKVLSWDWKEHPNEIIFDFKEALKDFGIQVFKINIGSDYAVVLGDKNLTEDEANAVYKKWEDEDD